MDAWNRIHSPTTPSGISHLLAQVIDGDVVVHALAGPAAAGGSGVDLNPPRRKAYYLREIIDRGLEDLEDYYLSAEVLQRVRSGAERVYSLNEARRNLDLDD